MTCIFNLFLAVACLATSVPSQPTKRDINSIVKAMDVVAADIIRVNQTVDTLESSDLKTPLKALKISQEEKQINEDIDSVVRLVNASQPLDATDSARLQAESQYHYEIISSLLENIISHKSAFESGVLLVGDLSRTVQSGLKNGKSRVGEFADAAQKILAEGYHTPEADMQAAWNRAIEAYEPCGPFCLPDLSGFA